MSREEKQQSQQAELQKQLWSIANTLRGNMDANDFKNYILGLIFYEDDFEHLFEDLDLTSTKLGKTEEAKNKLISKVLIT
jgi:type I restriction enzyme M protein